MSRGCTPWLVRVKDLSREQRLTFANELIAKIQADQGIIPARWKGVSFADLRRRRKLNRPQTAQAAGMPVRRLERIEQGLGRIPNAIEILRLAVALKFPAEACCSAVMTARLYRTARTLQQLAAEAP